MATNDRPNLDLAPSAYRTAHTDRLALKVNKRTSRTIQEARYRAVAQWANGVDDTELALQSRLSGSFVNVREFGAIGDGESDDTDAIQDAIAAAIERGVALVIIPPGTFRTTAPIEYPGELTISGAGAQSTVIEYEGSGYAFVPETIGSRSFNVRFRELQISITDAAAGGIDLTDMSLARCVGVVVAGELFGDGFHVEGTTNGFAVYNRFEHCRALSCDVGFAILGEGSNDAHLGDCRTANCNDGVSIVDSNHVVISECCLESGDTGIRIESTTANRCDAITMIGNRFEGNDTVNIAYAGTAANIRYPIRIGNDHVTGTASSGTPTAETNLDPAGIQVTTPTQDTPFRLERTTNGGSFLPCLFVVDSNTALGSPSTIRAAAGRNAGRVFEGGTWNGSAFTSTFNVTATGDLTAATIDSPTATHATSITMTGAASFISVGLTGSSGNGQFRRLKGGSNNQTCDEWRSDDVAQWAMQHDSSENLNLLGIGGAVVWQLQQSGTAALRYVRHANGTRIGGASGPIDISGSGSPEGVATAPIGSTYRRTDGGAGTSFYVKESGAGNTGWVAK